MTFLVRAVTLIALLVLASPSAKAQHSIDGNHSAVTAVALEPGLVDLLQQGGVFDVVLDPAMASGVAVVIDCDSLIAVAQQLLSEIQHVVDVCTSPFNPVPFGWSDPRPSFTITLIDGVPWVTADWYREPPDPPNLPFACSPRLIYEAIEKIQWLELILNLGLAANC